MHIKKTSWLETHPTLNSDGLKAGAADHFHFLLQMGLSF